jgi:transposase
MKLPAKEGPELLKRWRQWATRSRFAPFRKLAKTFRQYWAGIVSYFACRITQGAIEAINLKQRGGTILDSHSASDGF